MSSPRIICFAFILLTLLSINRTYGDTLKTVDDNKYIASFNQYIHSIVHYPTGRDAAVLRPAGVVIIRITISRDGELKAFDLEKSSGSAILDRQAIQVIERAQYPKIPDDAFISQKYPQFSFEINFIPPN